MDQHLLPRLYLKGFTDQNYATPNHVWVFGATERTWKAKGVKVAAKESNYYSFRNESGTIDDSFEGVLSVIETKAAPLLHDKILAGKALDGEEKCLFALFVAAMFLRVPQYHDWLSDFAPPILQHLAERQHQVYVQHPELFEALKKHYRQEAGTSDADHLRVEDIAPSRFPPLKAAKPLVVGVSLLQALDLCKVFSQMSWTFLKASIDSFITSDSPCLMVDAYPHAN